MLETLRTFIVDEKTALKVHNIGITEILLQLIINFDKLEPSLAAEVT